LIKHKFKVNKKAVVSQEEAVEVENMSLG